MPIIPTSLVFDQQTLAQMLEYDPVVQYYREFFALLDWSVVPEPPLDPSRPGQRPHPQTAYIKALLIKICEKLDHASDLRTYLLRHPLLVLEIGFRPHLNLTQPYGFEVERTVPSDRWLREKQRRLERRVLQDLLAATVHALQEEVPGLGETVAFDVKHLYAWVKENNPRVYVKDRYCKEQQPKGDPDCRVGVKRSTNQEQADGSTKEQKEYLWGYGTGIATSFVAGYGDVVLAEYTLPFNENDISYFFPLYLQTVAHLGHYPLNITADAAFDAWYVYQTCVYRSGMAAIALNLHGHPESRRDADGVPLCIKGLRMVPTYQFDHTRGYRSQRFRCPLLFPRAIGESCDQEPFAKGKGCVKDLNWELGGQMRVTLKRDGPHYKVIYRQRTSAERINSQAKAQHIERPHVRNRRSVANLNTLTYIVINAKALKRVRKVNADLLTPQLAVA
jgi:hypothetical protein